LKLFIYRKSITTIYQQRPEEAGLEVVAVTNILEYYILKYSKGHASEKIHSTCEKYSTLYLDFDLERLRLEDLLLLYEGERLPFFGGLRDPDALEGE